MTHLILDISNLATPEKSPWFARKYEENNDDPRGRFQRDRDRILHSDSFRKLQYKTQVFVVHEGDFFRTRLTHSLEVSQIGRTLASIFKVCEPLVEAICLGHDLGHAPFGHAGEEALQKFLEEYGLTWNANAHSLTVAEESEVQYFQHSGLNLTWATREGIARHATKFDTPVEEGEYTKYRQPSVETQIANLADLIAYCSHDVEDAIFARILNIDDLNSIDSPLWNECYKKAERELSGGKDIWQDSERERLRVKRIHRHLIDLLIRNVFEYTCRQLSDPSKTRLDDMRSSGLPLISFEDETHKQVDNLLDFMVNNVYNSPVVKRQNFRAHKIISSLCKALKEDTKLLPIRIQELINKGADETIEIARFVAGLTDRSATDLYAELFEPNERSMGHFIG